MGRFDLFDLDTGDLVESFKSLDAALDFVADTANGNGHELGSLGLFELDRRGRRKSRLSGGDLRDALSSRGVVTHELHGVPAP